MGEALLTAHRLLFQHGQPIPTWLTEKLDQYLEDSRANKIYPQSSIAHSDPSFFGLTHEQVKVMRDRYLRAEIKRVKELIFIMHREILNGGGFYGELNKLSRKLETLKAELNSKPGKENYNIDELKKVPIDMITEVGSNRFIIDNPFREEASPSNSLYWYKNNNRWHDFGTDKNGDVIDLVMAKYKCGLKRACEILSTCR